MPPLPNVAGVVKVQILASLGGQPYANVLHLRCTKGTGSITSTNLNGLATAVRAAWVTNLNSRLNAAFVLGNVVATDLSSATGAVGVQGGSDPGSAAGTPYPNNVAMCVSGKINRRYKGGRPRVYLGGFNQPNQADSRHWAAAWVTNMLGQWNAFVTASQGFTQGDFTAASFHCVHYVQNKVHLGTPFGDDIISWSIDSRIDSMRRRLGKP